MICWLLTLKNVACVVPVVVVAIGYYIVASRAQRSRLHLMESAISSSGGMGQGVAYETDESNQLCDPVASNAQPTQGDSLVAVQEGELT